MMMPGVTRKLSISTAFSAACFGVLLLMLLALAAPTQAQSGPLFPDPFRVEHHLEHHEAGGERMVFDSVLDPMNRSSLIHACRGNRSVLR